MKENCKSEDSFLRFSMHRTNMKLFIGIRSKTKNIGIYLHTAEIDALRLAEEGICKPSTLYDEAFLKTSLMIFAM